MSPWQAACPVTSGRSTGTEEARKERCLAVCLIAWQALARGDSGPTKLSPASAAYGAMQLTRVPCDPGLPGLDAFRVPEG